MNLSYLITEAKAFNGCEDGVNQLRSCETVDDLIKCYFDRIDYCLANNFPAVDFLMQHRDELRKKCVFIDDAMICATEECGTWVFLGNCTCTISFEAFSVNRIYVKHSSKINIEASGNSIVMVDALDNSDVVVDAKDSSKVVVNLYSKATCAGATMIIRKNKETYDL